jgi:hypothetical protein
VDHPLTARHPPEARVWTRSESDIINAAGFKERWRKTPLSSEAVQLAIEGQKAAEGGLA